MEKGRSAVESSFTRFDRKWKTSINSFYNGEPCWEWTAGKGHNGYGLFWSNKRQHRAHRWSYEYFTGTIPAGLQIDHLCRVRHCVNPNHLEVVTQEENTKRGVGITALNVRKTHCPKGHPYSGNNLGFGERRNGRIYRRCRACAQLGAKDHYYRSKTRNNLEEME